MDSCSSLHRLRFDIKFVKFWALWKILEKTHEHSCCSSSSSWRRWRSSCYVSFASFASVWTVASVELGLAAKTAAFHGQALISNCYQVRFLVAAFFKLFHNYAFPSLISCMCHFHFIFFLQLPKFITNWKMAQLIPNFL
jgi:hypothetical protein